MDYQDTLLHRYYTFIRALLAEFSRKKKYFTRTDNDSSNNETTRIFCSSKLFFYLSELDVTGAVIIFLSVLR